MKKFRHMITLGLTLLLIGCTNNLETLTIQIDKNQTELNSEESNIIKDTILNDEENTERIEIVNGNKSSTYENELQIKEKIKEAVSENTLNIEQNYDIHSNENFNKNDEVVKHEEYVQSDVKEVTISFAGDCTLGSFLGQSPEASFDQVYSLNGGEYFLSNVKEVFEDDDLTIVNLEGPFTNITPTNDKQFPIGCKPGHVDVLTSGSVELVNLANNHIWDCEQQGIYDTIQTLKDNNIGYFGEGYKHIEEVNGLKIGFLGYRGFYIDNNILNGISNDIQELKNNGANIIVVFFHYGEERQYYNNKDQERISKHAIDSGADIVIGGHPHVIQGVEIYNGRTICYSMGNFSFGANKNPSDKDTFIYQQTFRLNDDGTVNYDNHKIIPCRISSKTDWNDYKPTLLDGTDSERVFNRLKEYSSKYETSIFDIM